MAPAEGDEIVFGLLENVYRSFDYRDENAIYDALERSASGDLLTDIYLETRRSLELANQGGARAKVESVTPARTNIKLASSSNPFLPFENLNETLSILLVLRQNSGLWKITDLELLQEERLPS